MERIDCIYELVTESFTQSILKPHCCLLLRDSAVDSAVAFIVTVHNIYVYAHLFKSCNHNKVDHLFLQHCIDHDDTEYNKNRVINTA